MLRVSLSIESNLCPWPENLAQGSGHGHCCEKALAPRSKAHSKTKTTRAAAAAPPRPIRRCDVVKREKVFMLFLSLAACLALLAGCGAPGSSAAADLSDAQFDIGAISVPSYVRIVGLGEASHGAAQYHQMKWDVFKALVENNGCRTFIIEGDFGGALKVDQYINGGHGTAQEAVAEIGFAIYRTQEMADLVDWMRAYNETVPQEEALHFYGMDMQRFDNNKEYLFSVMDKTDPALSARYAETLAQLTDENRSSFDEAAWKDAKERVAELMNQLDAIEGEIVERCGQPAFEFARECAKSMYDDCDAQLSNNYNETRDRHMYEKAEWFLQHGDGSLLFVNGHNGHIGKTSVAGYVCLGELLSKNLGNGYYAIGTDAQKTQFQSQMDNGEFEIMEVGNENELNTLFAGGERGPYFVDFASVADDENWERILGGQQTITALNVGLTKIQAKMKAAYTVSIIPQAAFDGMIVFQSVTPSSILNQ